MHGGATPAEAGSESMAPPMVLHVDDDSVFLELTRGVLQQEGVEVESVTDPRVVPDRLAELSVDVVVSDYEMPEMSGSALFERVRADHPALPFVLFTGKERADLPVDPGTEEASWYVQKRGSGSYDRLVGLLESVLHQPVERPATVGSED